MLSTAWFYLDGVLLGLVLFAVAFPAGLFSSIDILFFRGLAVLPAVTALHAVLVGLALWWHRSAARAAAAAAEDRVAPVVIAAPGIAAAGIGVPVVMLAAALNLTAFVLVPVNLDRSISVFLLAWMEGRGAEPAREPDLQRAFEGIYVTRYGALDRRIAEQIASGNIAATPDGGYRLTTRGQAFVTFARFVGSVFPVDPRFLHPPQETVGIAAVGPPAAPPAPSHRR